MEGSVGRLCMRKFDAVSEYRFFISPLESPQNVIIFSNSNLSCLLQIFVNIKVKFSPKNVLFGQKLSAFRYPF